MPATETTQGPVWSRWTAVLSSMAAITCTSQYPVRKGPKCLALKCESLHWPWRHGLQWNHCVLNTFGPKNVQNVLISGVNLHRQGVFGRWGVLTTGVWNRGVPLHNEYSHVLCEKMWLLLRIYSCILYTQWSQISPFIMTPHSATTHFYHLVKTQS